MAERIALTVNGQLVGTDADSSVAAAVMNKHGFATRQSVSGQSRGPLCGMGICFECRMTVNGESHRRTCLLPCENGMSIETAPSALACPSGSREGGSREFDVVIVGAGPGGIAAACCAAEAGKSVALIDDNPQSGGQIWRFDSQKKVSGPAAEWLARLARTPTVLLSRTQCVGSLDGTTLLAESASGSHAIRYRRLILACGARERFLPFPGWTLPGVFGAGGLQALVKAGYHVLRPGHRHGIVVAGSGPLLPAVAYFLHRHGANTWTIAEQTHFGKLWRFAPWLWRNQRSKFWEALRMGMQLGFTPYRSGCWPIRAHGHERLESVTLTDGYGTWNVSCDTLACGFGLVPNLELPMMFGCAIEGGFVGVDEDQQTSARNVFAVGEITGIGGVDKAVIEGQIAGWAAADQPDRGRTLFRDRARMAGFVTMLEKTFALRSELRHLPDDSTIICRCEDVSFGVLKRHSNWRDAKLQTRCGMGPCQGRVCGPIVQFLFDWQSNSVRLPIFPAPLGELSAFPSPASTRQAETSLSS